MSNKDVQLGKLLSWILRHGAVKEGLTISPEGYVDVNQLLQHRNFRGKFTRADIERVAATNAKQRFHLRTKPNSTALEIKAHQGHSVAVSETELTPILEPKYSTIVHGTYLQFWPLIKKTGLSRMKRQHIHLAKGTLEDHTVISGIRRNVEIYIFVNLKKALEDGLKFYESDNGVILTPGNPEGYLEPKYFEKVVRVDNGYPPYTQPQDLLAAFSLFGEVSVERLTARFACLAFRTADAAQAALQPTNRVEIYGEFLTVQPLSAVAPPAQARADPRPPQTPKRDFTRSKLKCVIVPPESLSLSGGFAACAGEVLRAARLSQAQAAKLGDLYADVERALSAVWPGCVAMPFGSITTGLGIKTSDADCFLHIPARFHHPNSNFVNRAKKILQSYPQIFTETLAIPHANTPLVKFFHIPTETNCDLSFKTPLGAQNSKLIAFLLHMDPRLLPLAVLIKYWAKVHGLSGTGRLTNYALTMLIIFYLQQPPISILPSVHWLQKDRANDVIVDHWNTGFMNNRELVPVGANTSSLSELLGGFFQYYSTFDFDELTVSPFLGTPIKKKAFANTTDLPEELELYKYNVMNQFVPVLRHETPMCVQDPFEQCHNVASPISSRLASELKAFFQFAADAYEKEKLKNCDGFLKTILLEKPLIAKTKSHKEFRVCLFPKQLAAIVEPDWKAVVRELVMKIFTKMLKIPLEKVELERPKTKPTENKNEVKKTKEKYKGLVTNGVWKRKQFIKLYSATKFKFEEKQERITQEIITAMKHVCKVQFQLTVTYAESPKSVALVLKFQDGEVEAYTELGKFFLLSLQNWFATLLKDNTRTGAGVIQAAGESADPEGEETSPEEAPSNDQDSDDNDIAANNDDNGDDDDEAAPTAPADQ